jgi:hypothetical protein
MTEVRKGQAPPALSLEEFRARFRRAFFDPAFRRDTGVQEETRNVARAVVNAVRELRAGRLPGTDAGLVPPRPK